MIKIVIIYTINNIFSMCNFSIIKLTINGQYHKFIFIFLFFIKINLLYKDTDKLRILLF
jgi:hypothetical protein